MRIKASVSPVDRGIVERVANIVGPASAAAKAIADLDAKLADGKDVCIWEGGGMYFVGPPPRMFEQLDIET